LEEHGATGENRIPGMVERVVYVGSTMQVFVRLGPGEALQASIQNVGQGLPYEQGHPVAVHLPADAVRVLADVDASTPADEDLERAPTA
jgi:spermidine/putrescine transport system ATP-binding protein